MTEITPISYPIFFAKTLHKTDLQKYIPAEKYSQIIVITDENTSALCYPILQNNIPPHAQITISAGEQHKHIDTCKIIWNALAERQADRKALVINLGGGVIGDMGGFAASTYKRGIDFIQMPTTLLSQVDASVGGKLGVDLNGIKNIIGVFQDPVAVYISTEFLNTLPERQLTNGFAEVIKHGLIADAEYWKFITQLPLQRYAAWLPVIERSVEIKKRIVELDYKETGLRKILNFGHTVGHAVETWSMLNDEHPLLHGEAIAIGMICEAFLSHIYCHLHAKQLAAIVGHITSIFPAYKIQSTTHAQLISYMLNDKKNNREGMQFSLLENIGTCVYNIQVKQSDILDALQFYSQL